MRSLPPPPASRRRAAFTLVELLVVITIIAVLAGVLLPAFGSVQLQGRKTQSLSNMRQLGTALILYCGQNEGQLPAEDDNGNGNPPWGDTNPLAWFNALPTLGSFPPLSSFAKGSGGVPGNVADFYTKRNLLWVPAAKYPNASKLLAPLFAVTMNSKLNDGPTGVPSIPAINIRLQNFQQPARTVIFQEAGVPGEPSNIQGVSSAKYNGQCKSYANRAVARYNARTVITFADGHSESLTGYDITDPATGLSYYPQVPATPPATGHYGKVYWTMATDGDPRQ